MKDRKLDSKTIEDLIRKYDPEDSEYISDEEQAELDDAMSLKPYTIRLQQSVVLQYKEIARQQGLGYQTFIRQLLTNHLSLLKKDREDSPQGKQKPKSKAKTKANKTA